MSSDGLLHQVRSRASRRRCSSHLSKRRRGNRRCVGRPLWPVHARAHHGAPLSPQVRVRAAALITLQSLEPHELVKHVDTAVRCLQDPSARVRICAVDAMDKLLSWGKSSLAIGHHPLETTLETKLETTLETTLPSIKRYVPQLVHCLRDEDAIVRQRAISALLVSLEVPELVPYVEQVSLHPSASECI